MYVIYSLALAIITNHRLSCICICICIFPSLFLFSLYYIVLSEMQSCQTLVATGCGAEILVSWKHIFFSLMFAHTNFAPFRPHALSLTCLYLEKYVACAMQVDPRRNKNCRRIAPSGNDR
jgi:hypothetical protein